MCKNIARIIVALSSFLISISSCAKKQQGPYYTDPKGRFSVEVPSGWKIQEFRGGRSRIVFYKGKNNVTIDVEEYNESPAISEKEKDRVRSALGPSIKARFGGEIADIWEKSITIDGVKGWLYGFSIPSRRIRLKMVMYVKNRKIHTIVSTCDPEEEKTWESLVSSFKSS